MYYNINNYFQVFETWSFTVTDPTQTVFTLTSSTSSLPLQTETTTVFVDSIIKTSTLDYTLDTDLRTITFLTPVLNGSTVLVRQAKVKVPAGQQNFFRNLNATLRRQRDYLFSWNKTFYDNLEWEVYPGVQIPFNYKRTSNLFIDRNNLEFEVGYTFSNLHPLSADPSQTRVKMNPEYLKVDVKTGPAFYIERSGTEMVTTWYTDLKFNNNNFAIDYQTGNTYLMGTLGVGTRTPNSTLTVQGTTSAINILARDSFGFERGGAQTQTGSKSGAVTINAPTGLITMNGAQLLAQGIVSFTLNNTFIEADDTVLVQHVGTGTLGAYQVTADSNAGSAIIYVKNTGESVYTLNYNGGTGVYSLSREFTTNALSEAIQLRFVVIKSANS
jgi:hypothetical protein